jgi:hypothetical protein
MEIVHKRKERHMKHPTSSNRKRFRLPARTVITVLIVALAATLVTSCDGPAAPGRAGSPTVPAITTQGTQRNPTPALPAAEQAAAPQELPIRAALFVDETMSMEAAAVARVTPQSLAPLLDRLATSGGEIALGFVRDRSNGALLRLFVPAPPEAPAAAPVAPENIFAAAAAKKQQDSKLAAYEQSRRAWQADALVRTRAFADAVAPFLAREPDAPSTDIRSAVVRADVFLSEPPRFPRGAKNLAVFVSDGVDTLANGAAPRMNATAEVLVVNGTGSIGYLAPYQPVRFESVEAAMQYAARGGRP